MRLSKLEGEVFGGKKKERGNPDAKSLSDHIISLRRSDIFKQPLVPQEVHKKLEGFYRCDLSRVKVELIRLQKRGQLRKTSKSIGDKKYIAYVW